MLSEAKKCFPYFVVSGWMQKRVYLFTRVDGTNPAAGHEQSLTWEDFNLFIVFYEISEGPRIFQMVSLQDPLFVDV